MSRQAVSDAESKICWKLKKKKYNKQKIQHFFHVKTIFISLVQQNTSIFPTRAKELVRNIKYSAVLMK